MDFLAVGGISLLAIPLVWACIPYLSEGMDYPSIGTIFIVLSFFINYPHFLYSYLLLYGGWRGKMRDEEILRRQRWRFRWVAFAVPILLLGIFGGALTHAGNGALSYLIDFYLVTSAWHYAKQAFGVLITLHALKGVQFSRNQRRFFFWNSYLCLAASLIVGKSIMIYEMWNRVPVGDATFLGLPIHYYHIPAIVVWSALAFLCASFFASLIMLFSRGKRSVSLNGFTGYVVALYLWMPMASMHIILSLFIPVLHSLQYLPFVWRMRAGEAAFRRDMGDARHYSSFQRFVVGGFVLGALGFFVIPHTLDHSVGYSHALYGSDIFLLLFTIFINVHHFFIDNAIWRKENVYVRRYLTHPLGENSQG